MRLFSLIVISSLIHISFGQTTSKNVEIGIKKLKSFDPKSAKSDDFNAQLNLIEAPTPDGDSYRSFLMQQKIASRAYYQQKRSSELRSSDNRNTPEPILGEGGFIPTRKLANGTTQTLNAGIPSDNTCAISKNGVVLIGINSHIFAYDLNGDSAIFENHNIPLNEIYSDVPTLANFYDPKVVYDPNADRFVLTFLKDNSAATSRVVMCFSSTNNPADPWYVYELPGNPLDNNRWTDFPCLSLTADHVYYTANLIIPDVSWQVGFDGSIIWEMDKEVAFSGAADINATLYHDIKFEDKFVRNLHPVNGAEGVAAELFLLSNRNFDIENDTVFLLRKVNGEIDVQALVTDLPYGMPPNGRQEDTDLGDPTNGLQTNDARVLGAIAFDDEIQFVANSINPATGFSAIYHGRISLADGNLTTGQLIADDIRDFAYPNIAWTGNENCDREVIINFLTTSPTDFPSSAAVYVDNEGAYSPVLTILPGENYVDRLIGGYERWGDYTGLQRRFDKPGSVFSFTYHALQNKRNSGFGIEMRSPDSTAMVLNINLTDEPRLCGNFAEVVVQGGVAPYSYFWSNSTVQGSNISEAFCLSDSLSCLVVDARGCTQRIALVVNETPTGSEISLYPNPIDVYFNAAFTIPSAGLVEAKLYDSAGKLTHELLKKNAKPGINLFEFSTVSLAQGVYNLVIFLDGEVIYQEKVIKDQ